MRKCRGRSRSRSRSRGRQPTWGSSLCRCPPISPRLFPLCSFSLSLSLYGVLSPPTQPMCGIFFSLSTSYPAPPTDETCCLLRDRGPDSFKAHTVVHNTEGSTSKRVSYHLTFVSTVLSLRGDHTYYQPLVDPASQSVFCWNGEAWKVAGERIRGNDTEFIFQLFLQAVKPPSGREDATNRKNAADRFNEAVRSISGPFSFVFYDAFNSKLFFSRDCLGRRSLLKGFDEAGAFKLCSFCDGTATHFEEVGANGVHMVDLTSGHDNAYTIETLPWEGEASLTSHQV